MPSTKVSGFPPENCLTLIGMPGVGKSTLGVLLAKALTLDFVDTDLLIQQRESRSLQHILEADGYLRLREIEAEVILAAEFNRQVIATGGSAVYSPTVMAKLSGLGPVVYLQADLTTLERRVAAAPDRGIASKPGHTFADIYAERTSLYERYATHTLNLNGLQPENAVAAILSWSD